MSKFVKGAAVTHCLSGFGEISEEPARVLKVTKKGVWLDNGKGNDPDGPFDPVTGKSLAPSVPGFRAYIVAAAN